MPIEEDYCHCRALSPHLAGRGLRNKEWGRSHGWQSEGIGKRIPGNKNTDRARELRVRQTDSEGRLWGVLRNRGLGGWKWKRQVPRGHYIVDFYCADAKLVVELDGSQHLEAQALAYDERRTAFLRSEGLDVLRIPSNAIFENLEGVGDAILASCEGWRRREDREGVSIPSDLEDQVGAVCPRPRSGTGTAPLEGD